jgi:hypothetical protein
VGRESVGGLVCCGYLYGVVWNVVQVIWWLGVAEGTFRAPSKKEVRSLITRGEGKREGNACVYLIYMISIL